CQAGASGTRLSFVEILEECGDVRPAEVQAGGARSTAPGVQRLEVPRSQPRTALLHKAFAPDDQLTSARGLRDGVGRAALRAPMLEEGSCPVGVVAASSGHHLAELEEVLRSEGA